jgi:hypothetical protein
MYRRWRPVIPEFQATEDLYRRYRRADTREGLILPSALQFPKKGQNTGHSVNRGLFSRPEDALWNEAGRVEGLGVFAFSVSTLPEEATCPETGRKFAFSPKHVPLKRNYAHSEVWCDNIPPQNAGYILPTRLVQKELRAKIQKNSRIVIPAEQ